METSAWQGFFFYITKKVETGTDWGSAGSRLALRNVLGITCVVSLPHSKACSSPLERTGARSLCLEWQISQQGRIQGESKADSNKFLLQLLDLLYRVWKVCLATCRGPTGEGQHSGHAAGLKTPNKNWRGGCSKWYHSLQGPTAPEPQHGAVRLSAHRKVECWSHLNSW